MFPRCTDLNNAPRFPPSGATESDLSFPPCHGRLASAPGPLPRWPTLGRRAPVPVCPPGIMSPVSAFKTIGGRQGPAPKLTAADPRPHPQPAGPGRYGFPLFPFGIVQGTCIKVGWRTPSVPGGLVGKFVVSPPCAIPKKKWFPPWGLKFQLAHPRGGPPTPVTGQKNVPPPSAQA
jgi:hypothetical protein